MMMMMITDNCSDSVDGYGDCDDDHDDGNHDG